MSDLNDCIFQIRRVDRFPKCRIPIDLKKGEAWKCDFDNKENECPIVDYYRGYCEDCHTDACNDCESIGPDNHDDFRSDPYD